MHSQPRPPYFVASMWLLFGGGLTAVVMTVLRFTTDWHWTSDVRGTSLVVAHAGLMVWGFGMLRMGQQVIATMMGARRAAPSEPQAQTSADDVYLADMAESVRLGREIERGRHEPPQPA